MPEIKQNLLSRARNVQVCHANQGTNLETTITFSRQDCAAPDFPYLTPYHATLVIEIFSLAEDVVRRLRETADNIERVCVTP